MVTLRSIWKRVRLSEVRSMPLRACRLVDPAAVANALFLPRLNLLILYAGRIIKFPLSQYSFRHFGVVRASEAETT
jgi:hypothetical protein